MTRYVIKDFKLFAMMADDLEDYDFYDAIASQNETYQIIDGVEASPELLVVVCDNKPKDLPSYGIEWVEQKMI